MVVKATGVVVDGGGGGGGGGGGTVSMGDGNLVVVFDACNNIFQVNNFLVIIVEVF